MRKQVLVPALLALIGLVFLTGGVSAYFFKKASTAACEACSMEVKIGDPSTHVIATADGVTRYGCCPICALAIAYYYENATISVPCFACGEKITITIENGNITSVTPSGGTYNVSVIFGAACIKNKIVCCQDCADTVKSSYGWAQELPVINLDTAFAKAKIMAATKFTITPRQITIPMMTYILIYIGIALLAAAPVTWFIGRLITKRGTPPA